MPVIDFPITLGDPTLSAGQCRASAGADSALALSLVIPAFNEVERLPRFLETAAAYLRDTMDKRFEIIVVDDGSNDATDFLLKEWSSESPQFRFLRHPANRGKGAALRTGLRAATGTLLLFADADGAASIEDERLLRSAIDAGADIAVGSRQMAMPGAPGRRSLWRGLAGRLFSFAVRMAVRPPVRDTQCGFKMLRASAVLPVLAMCREDGYLFDLELLLLAQRLRLKIAEVPICWHDVEGSKVRFARDPAIMLAGLSRMRRRVNGVPAKAEAIPAERRQRD
jgi:dolichyl-phosphate beta-glucosyltransferase